MSKRDEEAMPEGVPDFSDDPDFDEDDLGDPDTIWEDPDDLSDEELDRIIEDYKYLDH